MSEQPFDSRYSHLDSRVTHLDNRVSSMAEDLSATRASVGQLVLSMNKLTDRMSQPTHTNWIGIGTLVLGIILGGSEYISLRLDPVSREILQLEETNTLLSRDRKALYEEVSSLKTQSNNVEKQQFHIDELYHSLDLRLRAVEVKTGEVEASSKATGDYMTDLLIKMHNK